MYEQEVCLCSSKQELSQQAPCMRGLCNRLTGNNKVLLLLLLLKLQLPAGLQHSRQDAPLPQPVLLLCQALRGSRCVRLLTRSHALLGICP